MNKTDLDNLKRKLRRWFERRNGTDTLGRDVCYASLFLVFIDVFLKTGVLTHISFAGYLYSLFRAFSTNVNRRSFENQKYLELRWKAITKFQKTKTRLLDQKDYHYYKCPNCGQTLRVPRGKGKIEITCPKCGHKFDKKS